MINLKIQRRPSPRPSPIGWERGVLMLVAFALATTEVRAHSVWIEPQRDGRLALRFAEPDGKFETSPGHLESLSAPIAFMLSTNAPVKIEAPKKSDHFALDGASSANTVCAETVFTVRGKRKPHFYARWQPAGPWVASPLLTLDLVPTNKSGEVRAYFRGKALGGIKATLRTPDEKEQELTADQDGFLHFDAKLPGQYLLTVAHHREPIAGFYGGQPYEQTSHNAALSWRQ